MADKRKRVDWKRVVRHDSQYRIRGRSNLGTKPDEWMRKKGSGLSTGEAVIRKWVTFFCVTFFLFTMCSAGHGKWALRSPFLRFIGCMVCAVYKTLLILVGSFVWLFTENLFALRSGVYEFPSGHPGVFRVFLAAVPVTIALYVMLVNVAGKYISSDQAKEAFMKCMHIAMALMLLGVLGTMFKHVVFLFEKAMEWFWLRLDSVLHASRFNSFRQEDLYDSTADRDALLNADQDDVRTRERTIHTVGPAVSADGVAWDEEQLDIWHEDKESIKLKHRVNRRCDCGTLIAGDTRILGTCSRCSCIVCNTEGCASRCERCGSLVCKSHAVTLGEHVFCTRHIVNGIGLWLWERVK
jgi:hypothetical protein